MINLVSEMTYLKEDKVLRVELTLDQDKTILSSGDLGKNLFGKHVFYKEKPEDSNVAKGQGILTADPFIDYPEETVLTYVGLDKKSNGEKNFDLMCKVLNSNGLLSQKRLLELRK
jgi:hypothetical protein